jgi:hypothetical protein
MRNFVRSSPPANWTPLLILLAIIGKRRNLNIAPTVAAAWGFEPVVGVRPGVRQPANGALTQQGPFGSSRPGDRCHSLMRHWRCAATLAVGLLSSTMRVLSRLTCLVTLARSPDLVAPPAASACFAAIALTAVAASANCKHRGATWKLPLGGLVSTQ